MTHVAGECEAMLDELLPSYCMDCGEALPQAGQPCAGCGAVPTVTRTEAEQRLAQPGMVALIQAARLRAEVRRGQERLSAMLREADAIDHAAALEAARAEAAAKLPPLRAAAAAAAGDLEAAQGRERDTAGREADARANFTTAAKAEEAARRCGASAAQRTGALVRLRAASAVLEGDQALAREAAAQREAAAGRLAAACAAVERAEDALRGAQEAAANPGRAPKSAVTLALDLVGQAQSGDLTEAEAVLVRAYGHALAAMTGAGEDIAARAVEVAEAAKEQRVRDMPAFVRRLPDGTYGTEVNPWNKSTPSLAAVQSGTGR